MTETKKSKFQTKTCANCGNDYEDSVKGRHAHITVKNNVHSDDIPPLVISTNRQQLHLCPECSERLVYLINNGLLLPRDDIVEDESKIRQKKLIEFCLPHDAFFYCSGYGSFTALLEGRDKKFTFTRLFMEKKNIDGKLHFDLRSNGNLYPGAILQIGGRRGADKISRFIIVVSVDRHALCYYLIDEERARMAIPDENTILEVE